MLLMSLPAVAGPERLGEPLWAGRRGTRRSGRGAPGCGPECGPSCDVCLGGALLRRGEKCFLAGVFSAVGSEGGEGEGRRRLHPGQVRVLTEKREEVLPRGSGALC